MTITLKQAAKRWANDVSAAGSLLDAAEAAEALVEEMQERIADAAEAWLDSDNGNAFEDAFSDMQNHSVGLRDAAEYTVDG